MESIQFVTQAIMYIIMLAIAVAFLLNLQNTIKAAEPGNRAMKPGMVWIQLIPIVGVIYSFVVAGKVSDTIASEYKAKGHTPPSARPTYGLGITFAVISLVINIFSLYFNIRFKDTVDPDMPPEEMSAAVMNSGMAGGGALLGLMGLVWLVIFIIYWVQTAGYKNKMKTLPNNRTESQIFGQF